MSGMDPVVVRRQVISGLRATLPEDLLNDLGLTEGDTFLFVRTGKRWMVVREQDVEVKLR